MQRSLRYFKAFTGIIIVVLVISMVDFRRVWDILKRIDLFILFCAFLFVFVIHLTKAWRWKYILDKQRIAISFKEALSFYLQSVYMGLLTPGRVGEVGRAFMIHKRCGGTGRSLFGIFLERATDLVILSFLSLWGVYRFFPHDRRIDDGWFYGGVIIGALGVPAIIWVVRPWRLLKRFSSKKMIANVLSNWKDFKGEFAGISLFEYLVFGLLSALGWVLYFFILSFLAQEIDIRLTLPDVVQLTAVSSLVAILPVSYLGLGTRDATLIYLFSMIHLSGSAAVAFSCLFLLIYSYTFMISAVSWFFFTPKSHVGTK